MGRALRTDIGNHVYHVLNRGNARSQIFKHDKDYQLFETILELAKDRVNMRILSYCIMPNHWHLVVYPRKSGDLARFVNWLTLTHTQRFHARHNTIGHGHVYQGRYKSFLCSTDAYFLQLIRYVERNPLRANLVTRAEDWRWGSAWRRQNGIPEQKKLLDPWPVEQPKQYRTLLNEPQSESELEGLRHAVNRGNPFGSEPWTQKMIEKFNLETTIRPRGRPRKGS